MSDAQRRRNEREQQQSWCPFSHFTVLQLATGMETNDKSSDADVPRA